MATLDALQSYTIADVAKATGDDGKLLPIYDAIQRRAPLMKDAVWKQANRPEFHRFNRFETAITGTVVGLNEGITGSKNVRNSVDEHLARIEDNSLVDTRMKDYYPDILAFRNQEDTKKIKDISFQAAGMIFTAKRTTDAKSFDGLYKRLDKVSPDSGGVVEKADTSGSALSSIILVNWAEDGAHLIHPLGSKTFGVELEDRGKVRVLDANSKPYWAYETWLTQRIGLAVVEPKSIARIANIDTAVADIWTTKKVMNIINKIMAIMNTSGKVYAYLSPIGFSLLNNWVQDKSNIQYKLDEFGKQFIEFAGITWRISDSILNNESLVS